MCLIRFAGGTNGQAAIGRQHRAFLGVSGDALANVIGHAPLVGPMRDYCTGLLLPCERKSVEPMAAATAHTGAQHQSLLHFLVQRRGT